MRKIMVICGVTLLVFTLSFINVSLAKDKQKGDPLPYYTDRENMAFIIDDLAEFIAVDAKKIDIVKAESITNQEWANQYNDGFYAEVMFGTYRYTQVTLEYKKETYTYGIVYYYVPGNTYYKGSMTATLDPIFTGDEKRIVTNEGELPNNSIIIEELIRFEKGKRMILEEGQQAQTNDPLFSPEAPDIEEGIIPSQTGQ